MKKNPMKSIEDVGYIDIVFAEDQDRISINSYDEDDEHVGEVLVEKNIDGTFSIHSYADHGYGPLLYELAIEFNSLLGRWTRSGTLNVSKEAINVWNKFYERSDMLKRENKVFNELYAVTKGIEYSIDINDSDFEERPQDIKSLDYEYMKQPVSIFSKKIGLHIVRFSPEHYTMPTTVNDYIKNRSTESCSRYLQGCFA
jgi:hypothetical protein